MKTNAEPRRDFYGKAIERSGEKGQTQVVHYTSIPPEVDAVNWKTWDFYAS
jgi:hypothetical protein